MMEDPLLSAYRQALCLALLTRNAFSLPVSDYVCSVDKHVRFIEFAVLGCWACLDTALLRVSPAPSKTILSQSK